MLFISTDSFFLNYVYLYVASICHSKDFKRVDFDDSSERLYFIRAIVNPVSVAIEYHVDVNFNLGY